MAATRVARFSREERLVSLEELTQRKPFYATMRLLTEAAWRRNLTVEALLALTDLLDPPQDAEAAHPAGETSTPGTPG
ncbi:hypothetical protein Pma05_04240 [Plantactinospora mayteni]|uniref:ANTAR domain-containing protein n=1 Tax=Plantactinospora mayteni TaxID=566021 RepID=A0ABQ4EGJ6_9ACTN|nr:hypothetical protein Pma05_04240 [Plantactinospora mayteni]